MKKKLIAILKRSVASYMRALASVAGGLQLGALVDWTDASGWHQIIMSVVGGLVGPVMKFFMQGADALDESADRDDPQG